MLALVLVATLSAASDKPEKQLSLALPGLSVVRLNKGEGAIYTEQLAQALVRANVRVITARDIGAMLGLDRQKQLMNCTENNCSAELVGAMGASGLIVGDIGRLGDEFALNVKILSSKDGTILAIHNARVPNQKELALEVERAAKILVEQLRKKRSIVDKPPPPVTVAPPTPVQSPEVTQPASSGSSPLRTWSYVTAGVGAAAIATGVVLKIQSDKEWEGLQNAKTSEAAQQHYSTGKAFQTWGYTGIGVGSGLLVGGVIMFFAGSDAPTARVSISPNGFQLGLSGALP